MLRRVLSKCDNKLYSEVISYTSRFYCERSRRKGDGTKTDIFEEKAAASQDEYFRKKTRRQVQLIREQLKKEKAERDAREEKELEETQKGLPDKDKKK